MSEVEKMYLSLATVKELPNDAGKYAMCTGLKHTRYFLVSMNAKLAAGNAHHASPVIPVKPGFCLPADCVDEDVPLIINSSSRMHDLGHGKLQFPISFFDVKAVSPDLDVKPLDGWGIVAITFVSLLLLAIVCSTTFVHLKQKREARAAELPASAMVGSPATDSARPGQLLMPVDARTVPAQSGQTSLPLGVQAFSLIGPSGTITKLFEIPSYKPTDCLNGLRVLSMIWIIVGHSFLMPNGISGYMNFEDVLDSDLNHNVAENNPWFMVIISAESSVDTFFFMSGFLLSLLTLKEMESKG